jgi:DNA-binding transcriptional MerR regulator
MSELIKVGDLSNQYGVSTRTLRYYEEIGLIQSQRTDDYAYRSYDEAAVQRLEQILILRKLNISIKDIQRVFAAPGSDVVLEVLDKKVSDIDDEVALLHELKGIVLEFIRQIQGADFSNDGDVKQLYDKAKDIETQLANVDYSGNPSSATRLNEMTKKPSLIDRLLETTRKLDKKVPDVLVVRLPKFLAITSQYQTIEEAFGKNNLMGWMGSYEHLEEDVIFGCSHFFCKSSDHKFRWLYRVNESIKEIDTAPFEVSEFEGGLYATAVSIDGDDESIGKVENKIIKWLEGTKFIYDKDRDIMGNMPYLNEDDDDDIKAGLGYYQLQRYVPIKLRHK